jgi:uridylate kinase
MQAFTVASNLTTRGADRIFSRMSLVKRIVHLKQSGELLTDTPGERWTLPALQRAAERIGEVQNSAEKLGVAGLLVVSGGGNVPDGFGRGANMREKFGDNTITHYADVIGRRSTMDNTIMLAAALADAGIPYELFAAPHSAFHDPTLGDVKEYSPELVQAAYRENKVVLMAGGSGRDHQTTDAAVVEYARWQAKAYPDTPSIALKATKYNGVFDNDPATHSDAKQYAELSADFMLNDYERFKAVDRRCLEILKEAGENSADVRLQVYAAEYSVVQALENETLGTTIFSKPTGAVFA